MLAFTPTQDEEADEESSLQPCACTRGCGCDFPVYKEGFALCLGCRAAGELCPCSCLCTRTLTCGRELCFECAYGLHGAELEMTEALAADLKDLTGFDPREGITLPDVAYSKWWEVACPTCRAPPDKRCTTVDGGKSCPIHKARKGIPVQKKE